MIGTGSRIERLDEVRDRLRAAQDHIDAPRLLAAPDCTLARGKLKVLAEAAHRAQPAPLPEQHAMHG